ncbi:hypothetical protein LEP1GSC016_2289 [Leptospira borgpetersenii serovar Hardjo-bovis str. Sponselee]|uniref:Uncharacterized protein n=2 Tax=Leptospira borgpetersenii TaxID=174 RepID=M6C5S1_LEPBO|nr:hypothetical protein LEP1GSC016_2289 [Leptospira borgpetersenii serovar Hardjo-bovis str. Sponselee]EMO63488.1 hypothetical protein LEP1GSC133_4653 [Leptospira borgpetersenii serovar Pomona str. 200901868]
MVSFRPVFRNSRIFGRTPYILFDFQRCQPAIQTENQKLFRSSLAFTELQNDSNRKKHL